MNNDRYQVTPRLFEGDAVLHPRTAVAAIILDEAQRVLVQLRDDKPEIFFPNHWGCFGGAMEAGEEPEPALRRELEEELGIAFAAQKITRFITIQFNTKPHLPPIDRHFFIVRLRAEETANMTLGEGRAMEWMAYEKLLRLANVTPYDRFGHWLYFSQHRLPDTP